MIMMQNSKNLSEKTTLYQNFVYLCNW